MWRRSVSLWLDLSLPDCFAPNIQKPVIQANTSCTLQAPECRFPDHMTEIVRRGVPFRVDQEHLCWAYWEFGAGFGAYDPVNKQ